jgi:hypothetical protein
MRVIRPAAEIEIIDVHGERTIVNRIAGRGHADIDRAARIANNLDNPLMMRRTGCM